MNEGNNIFKLGLDQSMLVGLLTTVISVSTLYSDMVPPLAVVAMVLLAAGPVLIYTLQRRVHVSLGGQTTMWDLWMMGVVAIFFGALLTSLVTYGILEFMRPGFLYSKIEMVLDTYKQIPELKNSETTQALQMMLDEDLVPSALSYVLNMFVMTTCSGMVLSMVTGALAARRN